MNMGLQARPGAAVELRGNQPPIEGSTEALRQCGQGASIYHITQETSAGQVQFADVFHSSCPAGS